MKISGGVILVPKQIIHSPLWYEKPAWWFKVWFYILSNANFKDHNPKNKRGTLLTTYEEIHRGCKLGNQVLPSSIDNVIRHLKSTGHITTAKTTRGFIITVRNYNELQSFSTYSNDKDSNSKNETSTIESRHDNEIKETNEPFYNYLEKSFSSKETNFGENPRRGTKTPTDVVFLNHLNRYRPLIEKVLVSTSEPISNDIDAAYEGIIYYIRKYGHSFSENHPLYKKGQLIKCVYGILYGIWEIEQRSLPTKVALKEVIDRWFATTSYQNKNKLRLSVFASPDSSVFYRCFEGVLSDGESYRRITSAII